MIDCVTICLNNFCFFPLFSIMFPQKKANTMFLQKKKLSFPPFLDQSPTMKNSEYCIYIIASLQRFLSNILIPILELIARFTPSITMPCSESQPYSLTGISQLWKTIFKFLQIHQQNIASNELYENS